MRDADISGDVIGQWAGGRGGMGYGRVRSIKRNETILINVELTHQSQLVPCEDEKNALPSACVRACVRVRACLF